jgi:hypothetical protein
MTKTQPSNKPSWLYGDKTRIAQGFDRALLYELDVLEEHRKFAERSLIQHVKALDAKVATQAKGMTKLQKSEYFDYMHDEYVELTEIFPRLQWYSQFLIAYSTFENVLNRLCQIVQRRSSLDLSFKDLEGQGIARARSYLSKVAKVNTPFSSKHWNKALLLGEIRNAIAHRNGEIPHEPNSPNSLSSRLKKLGVCAAEPGSS